MIRVVVGLLTDSCGNILVGQRRKGTHMAGRWEFPGGKLHPGETALDALRRELREEISVEVFKADRLMVLEHAYEDRHVQLDTWFVCSYAGEPRSAEGQALQWIAPQRLADMDMLEADRPIIEALLRRRGPASLQTEVSSS